MPKYKYSAVSAAGEQILGEYISPDEGGVVAMLRQGGYYPTKIARISEKGISRQKVKVKPLAGFCSQMAAMLRAGVPIAKVLEILKEQTEDKQLRVVLEDVFSAVQRGNSLSEALNPHESKFPVIFINMVEAGEASGTLDLCLERAGVSFTRMAKLNNKIRNAMIYPSIILTVLIGLLLLMLMFVVPSFSKLYADQGAELPGFTQALINAGEFLQKRWYIPLGVLAAIIFAWNAWLSSDGGRTAFDRFKFRVPMINKMLNKVYASRFARTLASLTSAGVSLTHALGVTARSVVNKHMEKELYKVVDSINQGGELSSLLERMNLLPPMIIYMTRLGEESGTMDELLLQAADFYDEESDTALQAMMAMLEPALIILMAVVVVPILIGVVLPMFNLANTMM